jgi:uncharacterized phage protein (TIGR02218 family)
MKTALCVRIKRRDGLILRATTHDSDILVTAAGYQGTYRSAASLSPSAVQARASLAVDGGDLEGVLSVTAGITQDDIANGVYDQSRVTVFQTDWSAPSTVDEISYGVLGNKRRTQEGNLQMELRTISQLLAENQGDLYSTRCRATLGSGSSAPVLRRCGVNLTAFTFDEEVTGVVSARTVFAVAAIDDISTPPGFFSKGLVTFLTGSNTGAQREIRLHGENGELFLYDPLPADVEIGDDVRLIAGCDKTLATCRDKFNNVENFRGEPYIPGAGYTQRIADTADS